MEPGEEDPGAFGGAGSRIIAVANQKGGVGKSTTVVNLGAWLALKGSRVLLIDLDPQANASTGVGIDSRTASGNVYRMLVEDLPVDDAIEATSVRNLYAVPSTIDLAGAEIELVSAFSRELKLKKALSHVHSDFDFILIDCPPSLGLLTVNALAAASEVLVPIQCEFYALEGLGQLLKNVNLVQSSLNPDLSLSGIVLTMYDGRTKLADQVAQEVRAHFPGKVHRSVIPRSVRLSEAPSFGQPIALYDPRSAGSRAYEELASEILRAPAGEMSAGFSHEHAASHDAQVDSSAGAVEGVIANDTGETPFGSASPEVDFQKLPVSGPEPESPDVRPETAEDQPPASAVPSLALESASPVVDLESPVDDPPPQEQGGYR